MMTSVVLKICKWYTNQILCNQVGTLTEQLHPNYPLYFACFLLLPQRLHSESILELLELLPIW
jgi:hypothetical protein